MQKTLLSEAKRAADALEKFYGGEALERAQALATKLAHSEFAADVVEELQRRRDAASFKQN